MVNGVTHVVVSQVNQFRAGGVPVPMTRYTFFVGTHGPFMLEYAPGTDTTDKVTADMQAVVNKIQALGLTTTK